MYVPMYWVSPITQYKMVRFFILVEFYNLKIGLIKIWLLLYMTVLNLTYIIEITPNN